VSNLEIHKANESDLPDVLRLYAQPGMDAGHVLRLDDAISVFRRMSAYPQYAIYIARAGEEVVGTFTLLIMDNLAHMGTPSAIVESVVVDEGWRGRGVGKRMMVFAMDVARRLGCYKLALSSNRHREQAHAFYRSLGFEQHGLSFGVELNVPPR
jgi:GNAT superfamily N-acetyltransferase